MGVGDGPLHLHVNIDFMMYITLDTSHQTKNGSSQNLLREGALRHISPTYWEMTVTSQNVATILGLSKFQV